MGRRCAEATAATLSGMSDVTVVSLDGVMSIVQCMGDLEEYVVDEEIQMLVGGGRRG